ncbi:lamin tail domain-containing protein [bacterium]|nr:MAG: lamin tail domain-containing protein [bacterium]RIK64042.1 MAG: hypothetical protein DCC64_04835 [Planctomycetota bacterium]
MRPIFFCLVIALTAMLSSACGDYANSLKGDVKPPQASGPNPNNLPNPNTVPKPGGGLGYTVNLSPVLISEVLVNPGASQGSQYVELLNSSLLSSDIGGWVITDGNSTFTFPFGFQISAGSRVLVQLGTHGAATGSVQFAPSFNALPVNQGSLALLRSGNEVIDFVQWGGSPNSYEGAAASYFVWPAGDFLAVAPTGESYNFVGGTVGSSAWAISPATPGQ